MKLSNDEPMVTWLARRPRARAATAGRVFYTVLGLACLAGAMLGLGLIALAAHFLTRP